jgi:hypothetical protein
MIERHWDGIAAHCAVENKVALGFVEGLNNNVRVIQRRAYGLRDEEYLRLKILTCMLLGCEPRPYIGTLCGFHPLGSPKTPYCIGRKFESCRAHQCSL